MLLAVVLAEGCLFSPTKFDALTASAMVTASKTICLSGQCEEL